MKITNKLLLYYLLNNLPIKNIEIDNLILSLKRKENIIIVFDNQLKKKNIIDLCPICFNNTSLISLNCTHEICTSCYISLFDKYKIKCPNCRYINKY